MRGTLSRWRSYTVTSLVLFGAVFGAPIGWSGNTATQTVSLEVLAINELAVSGSPSLMSIGTATAGSQPTPATNSATSYLITTNSPNRKIQAKVDSTLPANTSLVVSLAAPTGATPVSNVALSTTDQDVVTGINTLIDAGKAISYQFNATVAAGLISTSRTVTFTLIAGS